MISKLLDSPAGVIAIVLGPSCAFLASCAALWLLWPSTSGWFGSMS